MRDLSYGPGMLLEGGAAGSSRQKRLETLRQACARLLILLMPGQVLWKLGWGLGAPSCPQLRANGTERRLRIDRMDRHAADADFEPDARGLVANTL